MSLQRCKISASIMRRGFALSTGGGRATEREMPQGDRFCLCPHGRGALKSSVEPLLDMLIVASRTGQARALECNNNVHVKWTGRNIVGKLSAGQEYI